MTHCDRGLRVLGPRSGRCDDASSFSRNTKVCQATKSETLHNFVLHVLERHALPSDRHSTVETLDEHGPPRNWPVVLHITDRTSK